MAIGPAPRLIVSDIDGTFINSADRVPPRVRDALYERLGFTHVDTFNPGWDPTFIAERLDVMSRDVVLAPARNDTVPIQEVSVQTACH